jgi:hypothetical protein
MTSPTTTKSKPTSSTSAETSPPTFGRNVAAAGLVASSVLLTVSVVLQPDLNGDPSTMLGRLDAAGWQAVVSAAGFAVGQLPFVAAALGIAHLLRDRAPRLGNVGAALSVIGAFGHAVFGGISLMYVAMSHDEPNRAAYAGLIHDLNASPIMLFSVLGLAGFVIGLLLLSIGLFRGHVGPRWAGPAIWAFLVVEFVGGSLSPHASYLSSTILLVVFFALARETLLGWSSQAAGTAVPESAR